MNLQYDEIFAQLGGSYHSAMQRFPLARSAEFARAFERFPVQAQETLLDLPSGGGYVAPILPQAQITSLELSAGFSDEVQIVTIDGAWPIGRFDHVLCVAALHHIDDHRAFILRLIDHLQPLGTLHLVDAAAGSPVARFLDEFVGCHNKIGHAGHYLPEELSRLDLPATIAFSGDLACPWRFENRQDLVSFCMDLFGLSGCTLAEVEDALETHIGIESALDCVQLNWQLRYADLRLP